MLFSATPSSHQLRRRASPSKSSNCSKIRTICIEKGSFSHPIHVTLECYWLLQEQRQDSSMFGCAYRLSEDPVTIDAKGMANMLGRQSLSTRFTNRSHCYLVGFGSFSCSSFGRLGEFPASWRLIARSRPPKISVTSLRIGECILRRAFF